MWKKLFLTVQKLHYEECLFEGMFQFESRIRQGYRFLELPLTWVVAKQ